MVASGLEGGVLLARGVAGAVLVDAWQFAVADDPGLGVILAQLLQQFVEGVLLQFGAGVGGNAMLVETALVTDGYRVAIVACGMDSANALWQCRDDAAVATHVIVVGRLAEPILACFDQFFCREVLIAARG